MKHIGVFRSFFAGSREDTIGDSFLNIWCTTSFVSCVCSILNQHLYPNSLQSTVLETKSQKIALWVDLIKSLKHVIRYSEKQPIPCLGWCIHSLETKQHTLGTIFIYEGIQKQNWRPTGANMAKCTHDAGLLQFCKFNKLSYLTVMSN